jgi:16S rRNA (guanine1207-N2)-methyltransferase
VTAADEAQHYFSAQPRVRSHPGHVTLRLPDLTLPLETDRGVFAAEQVDVGTRYLLLDAPMPPPGPATVLDLGCGYGPIALAVAQRAPAATVVAVDVNERARALCRANAVRAGLDRVVVCAPEEVAVGARFDLIYSNPPIRIGKAALQVLLEHWLDRLQPGGTAWLVVHKHLGSDSLQRWLSGAGFATRRAGSRVGYRLLEVSSRPALTEPAERAGTAR